MGSKPLRLHLSIAAIALAAVLPTAQAEAEFLPSPARLQGPAPVLRELTDMLVNRGGPEPERLGRLDAMLALVPEPSELRGFIQYVRAVNLRHNGRLSEAREALEESIRLLQGYSAPLLFAADLEAYADRPELAADYLIRASHIDPGIVRQFDAQDLLNLRSRLGDRHDTRRMGRLAERMVAIGWQGDDLRARSLLAFDAIRDRMESGDVAGARVLIPRLIVPSHMQALLIVNRYRAIWADIETWAGSRLEKQWPLYLRELQARFRASGDPVAARRYANALRDADHYETIVREILPLFRGPLDRERDYDLVWVAPIAADALARLGRWQEIDLLFDRAAAVWPLGIDANALNIAANRARLLLIGGRSQEGLASIDAVIADARRRHGEVSSSALASMHLARACGLQDAGRGRDALDSASFVLGRRDLIMIAELHLCFGRHEAARAALIEGLADEQSRDEVLQFIQPDAAPPMQSDYGRMMKDRRRALRADPILIAAALRHGRVLEFPASAGAPPETAR